MDARTSGGDEAGAAPAQGVRAFLARHERAAIVILLLAGLALRLAWVSQDGRLKPFISEMFQVAVCFAKTGVLGDSFYPGQGPTAHANPVTAIIGGLTYRAFGVGSLTSEILLTALALSYFGVALMAFYAAFRRMGLGVEWRLAALAAALLLPLNFKFETQSLRLFEGAMAVALLACALLVVVRLDARPELRARDYVLPSLIGGLLALMNPPAGLGAYAAFGVLTLKRAPVRRWPGVVLVMSLGLALFLAPWAIRNELVFGRLMLTRSNFPLEHAIGFHPAAVAPADPAATFVKRIRSLHPYSTEAVSASRSEVMRVGELAFMDRLARETSAWERAHPGDAVRIGVRHLQEYWLPPKWWWRIYTPNAPLVPLRQAFLWTTTLAAFAALVWGLFRAPLGPSLYVACVLIIPSLPYVLVQPVQRYRYLVFVLTLFLAAEFGSRACRALARRRRTSPA